MQFKMRLFLLGLLFRWRMSSLLCLVASAVGFAFLSQHLVLNIMVQFLAISATSFVAYVYRELDIFSHQRRALMAGDLDIVDAGIRAKESLSSGGQKVFALYLDWQFSRCTCFGTGNKATGPLDFLYQRSGRPCPIHTTTYSPMADFEEPVPEEEEINI